MVRYVEVGITRIECNFCIQLINTMLPLSVLAFCTAVCVHAYVVCV